MPSTRYDWAKVYCDILRHPLLLGRPDSDKVLVLGLILHAKEYAPDGVLRGINAVEAKRLFGISATTEKVQAGLDYLLNDSPSDDAGRHWLYRLNDQTLVVRDFAERQRRSGDTPEAHRTRQRNYKLRGLERVQSTIGDLSGLPELDRAQIQKLLAQGRTTAAIELFNGLKKRVAG